MAYNFAGKKTWVCSYRFWVFVSWPKRFPRGEYNNSYIDIEIPLNTQYLSVKSAITSNEYLC